MADKLCILFIGATGYIGGSALSELLNQDTRPYLISALIRKPEQVQRLEEVGVKCLLFSGLEDLKGIRDASAKHDIVLAAASARDAGCAKACIEGLSKRRKETGHAVHYIHTSGASMLGDWPESGGRVDTTFHSDLHEDIYKLEKNFPDEYSPVRKVNQLVVHTGEELGVQTYIVPPPLIFGRGTGIFTEGAGQVYMLLHLAMKLHQAVMVGSGSGVWSRVHISDLSKLFYYIIDNILKGKQLPSGRSGYYFAENGAQSWKDIAQAVGKVGKEAGSFDADGIHSIGLEVVAAEFYDGDLRDAEAVLASNARTKADRARQVLEWKPEYGQSAFDQEIKDVFEITGKS